MNYYYTNAANEVQGPCSLAELQRLLASGSLPPSCQALPEGSQQWQPLTSLFSTPPVPPPLSQAAQPAEGGGMATLIPYKNPTALTSYYLGVFSLIPCIGFLLAIVAVILGIVGLKKVKLNPLLKGTAHAWVGIGLGSFVIIAHLTVLGIGMFH